MIDPSFYESHPIGPVYVVARRFYPGIGYEWDRYVEWSGLRHLSEVVSLDGMLCERAPERFIDDDWPHVVNEDFMLGYFTNLDHLLKRAGPLEGKSVLCAYRNPVQPPVLPTSPFVFTLLGYDIVDVTTAISATLNRGGFPGIFSAKDLNTYGLVESLERAREIQQDLMRLHDDGRDLEHTQTHVWGLARAAL